MHLAEYLSSVCPRRFFWRRSAIQKIFLHPTLAPHLSKGCGERLVPKWSFSEILLPDWSLVDSQLGATRSRARNRPMERRPVARRDQKLATSRVGGASQFLESAVTCHRFCAGRLVARLRRVQRLNRGQG